MFLTRGLGWIALVSLLALAFSSCAAPREVHVVLLGGQSNMVGHGVYGELDRATRKRLARASKRVRVSTDGGRGKPLSFRSAEHHVREFGPELFMGLILAERYPERRYLFVKTAVGGTSLQGAWNPDWSEEKATATEIDVDRQKMNLYFDHQKHVERNLRRLDRNETAYRIFGVAWMQGERDSHDETAALSYEVNLKKLIGAYRRDLKQPELPFAFAQVNNPPMGIPPYFNGLSTVRKAMGNVTRSEKHTAMIPTSIGPPWADFPKLNDDVHYNTEGQKRFGIAFAEALIKLNDERLIEPSS